ncbi:hypothetical protein BSKO_05946 [Bryopsis sp. KO-2023]|nr:hypothetical protein BSKO_05946 [Bryopsis sp. KO-2023]
MQEIIEGSTNEAESDFIFDTAHQVRELQAQNARLLTVLEGKENELCNLRCVPPYDKRARLEKHSNRNLQLALQNERQKISQLRQKLEDAKGPNISHDGIDAEGVEEIAREIVKEAAENADRAEKEASAWREKYSQATNRVSQAEQKAYTLEIEVKKLQRALQREVGEDISLTEILDNESDWRGRAQKIIALQDKLKEMRAAQGIPNHAGVSSSRKNLERMARDRRDEVDALNAELKRAQEDLKLERQNSEKAVCRRKVMEREVRGMKDKLSILLEKTTNDDKLVAALKGELGVFQKKPKSTAQNR